MAKKKLSVDELLIQALVKDKDKPYGVPCNWVWVKMGNTLLPMTTTRPEINSKAFKYVDIEAIDNKSQRIREYKTIETSEAPSRASRGLDEGNTLFSVVRPYLRNIAYVYKEYEDCIASTGFYVCKPSKAINSKYLYHLLCSEYIVSGLTALMKGDNSPSIRNNDFEEFPIPLPPLPEQKRIVGLIESLFEKLDRAKELVQNALDSFEERKSAIFKKAFKGELTSKWRRDNKVDFDKTWRISPFKEIATVKSNLVNPGEYKNFPHIAPDNIEKRTGNLLAYNTIEQDCVTSGKHRFYAGQILYSKIRPYLSKVVIIDFDGLCSADMYPIESILNTRYLWYYMLSDDFVMAASSAGSRSVLPKINQKELGELKIVFSSIDEQTEIVRILDNVLQNELKAKELCDVIKNVDLMKKSILARAFRGELSTNNPNEGSAFELLKEVLKERV